MRTVKVKPFLAILAPNKAKVPAMKAEPPNTWAYRKPPWLTCTSEPTIGGPVKQAIETTLKHMPVRTPILFKSVVRLAHAAGNRL